MRPSISSHSDRAARLHKRKRGSARQSDGYHFSQGFFFSVIGTNRLLLLLWNEPAHVLDHTSCARIWISEYFAAGETHHKETGAALNLLLALRISLSLNRRCVPLRTVALDKQPTHSLPEPAATTSYGKIDTEPMNLELRLYRDKLLNRLKPPNIIGPEENIVRVKMVQGLRPRAHRLATQAIRIVFPWRVE